MEIKKDTPREIDYIKFLLLEYNQKGRLRKLVDKFKSGKKGHTKTGFVKLIGRNKDDKNARDFRDKLIDENILVKEGKQETGSNKVPIWVLDKNKLIQKLAETDYYQENRAVFIQVLKKAEGKEIL